MSREAHVRICGSRRVRFPPATRPAVGLGSVGVSCEHRNNDRRGDQVQSNQGDLAGGRVCERRREGAGDRREAGGYLDEPLTWGGAAPVQQGEEHTADDGGDEGDLGEAGEWDLAVYGQRDSGGPQGNRTGGRDRGGQDTDRDRGARQRAGQPGRGVLDSDFGGGGHGGHGWFLLVGGGALCTCLLYTSPSPRDRTRSRMPSSA